MHAATDLESAADRLMAEAVGLLLEPVALDETMSGPEALEVARSIAEVGLAQETPGVAAVSDELRSAAAAVSTDSELVNDLLAACAAAGVPMGNEGAWACLRLLRCGASVKRVRALRALPEEALELTRVEVKSSVATLRRFTSARGQIEQRISSHAHLSVLDLDLDREIRALRDRGLLFGLISTTSDAARDRVAPHLREPAARAGSLRMADILEGIRPCKDELAALDREWEAQPPWCHWLMPAPRRPISRARVGALEWALNARDAGTFGTTELSLICDSRVRRFLSEATTQSVRLRAEESARGPFQDEAVARFAFGMAIPASTPPQAVVQWRRAVDSAAPSLARAALVVRLSQRDPTVAAKVQEVLHLAHGPFGPADPSRPQLRRILQEVNADATASQVALPDSSHPAISAVMRQLGQAQRDLTHVLTPRPPLRGPLRVAIAGRTKAGKTTLRKALTRDADLRGVGRGAHRTTRQALAFSWHGLEFIDTPGIAAYDDDFDADAALDACQEADAVLWVYAETIRSEELDYLRVLLALGKPVLVVYNAKWRVDTAGRLDLFARQPHLAFRHMDGHAERVAQVAALAGASAPQVLPSHLGAAFEALRANDEVLRESALSASRLPRVEQALGVLLELQAQPLRAAALTEAVRTPLTLAGEVVAEAARSLPRQVEAARDQIATERPDLARCVDAAERAALGVLRRDISEMRSNADAFVRRTAGGAPDPLERWQRFVEDQHLDRAVSTFVDHLNRDSTRLGVLLEHEDHVRRRVLTAVALVEGPRRSIWGLLGSALTEAVKRVLTGLIGGRSLGRLSLGRGAVRKVPWLGWGLLAADAVGGAARGFSQEAERSRIEEALWRKDAQAAVRAEIDRLQMALALQLKDAAQAARSAIETQLAGALAAADAADDQLRSYAALAPRLQAAALDVDLVLARRLAALCRLEPDDITRAERSPGSTFHIWVHPAPRPDHDELVRMIRTCFRENTTLHPGGVSLEPAMAAG